MILSKEELLEDLEAFRHMGRKIVTTNGVFDIIHVGHTRYLEGARTCGDILIVLLNSDESVRNLKGEGRPLVSEMERAEVLDSLGTVDYVVLFDAPTPDELLSLIRPDVHVKGGNYAVNELPEAELVESLGGKVLTLNYVAGWSTTTLIQEIVARFGTFAETQQAEEPDHSQDTRPTGGKNG